MILLMACLEKVGGATFDEGLALEARLATELAGTANFQEGVAAFLAKRPPEWHR